MNEQFIQQKNKMNYIKCQQKYKINSDENEKCLNNRVRFGIRIKKEL